MSEKYPSWRYNGRVPYSPATALCRVSVAFLPLDGDRVDVLDLVVGFTFGTGFEPFVDVALLDEGVEDVEDAVATPSLSTTFGTEHRKLVVRLGRWSRSKECKGLKLVDELVDDIPQPLCREREGNRSVRIYAERQPPRGYRS